MVNIDCCHLALAFALNNCVQLFAFFNYSLNLRHDHTQLYLAQKTYDQEFYDVKLQIRDISQVIIRKTNFSEVYYINVIYQKSKANLLQTSDMLVKLYANPNLRLQFSELQRPLQSPESPKSPKSPKSREKTDL